MVSYGCPNCHGALYVESFKEEGRKYTEIICINCARLWKPEQLAALVKAHEVCCAPEFVAYRARKLRLLIAHERPSVLKGEEVGVAV